MYPPPHDDDDGVSVESVNLQADESAQIDIEDGLSFASSQVPASEEFTDSPQIETASDGSNEEKQVTFSTSEDEDIKHIFAEDEENRDERERLSPVEEESKFTFDEGTEEPKPNVYDLSQATYDFPNDDDEDYFGDGGAYDLGKPVLPIDDDQTSVTPHRSGSSDYVLNTWIKRRDWDSVREFFKNPPKEEESLMTVLNSSEDDGETALHIACRKDAPIDIIISITEACGKNAVSKCNAYGNSSPLHHACHYNASPNVIQYLIKVGGHEAASTADDIGNLPLHWALSKRLSREIIILLIERGGRDTVTQTNKIGWTALHTASFFDADNETISYLIRTAGPDTVKRWDAKNRSPIDIIIETNPFSVESIITMLYALGEVDENLLALPTDSVNSILDWVRRQPTSEALKCLSVQRMLNDTFISRKYLTVWMIDLYFQIALVVLFSFGIDSTLRNYGVSMDTGPTIGLYLSIGWFLGREVIQLITTPFNEFTRDLKNWIDIAQVIFVFLSLDILVFRGGIQDRADVGIIIVTAGLVWINLLSVMGKAFYNIRLFIVYLQMLIWNLTSFFIGSVITIAAFAHMYYITNNFIIGACESPKIYVEDQDFTCSLSDTYFMTFSSIINGHWRFMEQPSTNPLTFLSFALALFTILLLFTSLIGQIVGLTSTIQETATLSFWANRLYLIVEINDFNETFGCGCCQKDIAHGSRWANGSTEAVVPMNRFMFSEGLKYKSFPEDTIGFGKWWVGDGKKSEMAPAFSRRIKYFLTWAPFSEILCPGREMERAIGGYGRNEEKYSVRLSTYFLSPIYFLAILLTFVCGLVTFGLVWPREMRKRIFCGNVNSVQNQRNGVSREHIEGVLGEVKAFQSEMKTNMVATEEGFDRDFKKLQNTLLKMQMLIKGMTDDSKSVASSSSTFDA